MQNRNDSKGELISSENAGRLNSEKQNRAKSVESATGAEFQKPLNRRFAGKHSAVPATVLRLTPKTFWALGAVMNRLRVSFGSQAIIALAVALSCCFGASQAQAQFVCGGSADGSEPQTGAGANAGTRAWRGQFQRRHRKPGSRQR
jgi:hypothetical protein